MKKQLALILALCLALTALVGCGSSADTDTAEPAETETAAEAPVDETAAEAEESEPVEVKVVDYAALYASHDPDEVVATANSHDIPWGEYFYWYYTQVSQMDNYFAQMSSYYGINYGWNDPVSEDSDETFAELASENTEVMLRQFYGIEGYAEKNKIALTDGDKALVDERVEEDKLSLCGEGATEDDFNKKLGEIYISRELYDRMCRIDKLYSRGMADKYGEDGEKVSDKEALAFLDDNGYLSASHILLMTTNPTTGEALSEDEVAEKKEQAEKIAEELAAIKDEKKLTARFAELKEKYDEDTGKTYYPDGYVFTEGTMVTEFEDAVKAMKAGEVSEVVESPYGYHVIMRLAPSADRTVSYSSDGTTAYSARYICASQQYSDEVESFVNSVNLSVKDGFGVNVADYVKTVTQ